MKNLLGYLTCVAVAILLRVYINGSGGKLVLYHLAIAFVISLAALLITKRKLVAAIKLSTEISAKNEEFDADIMLLNAIRIIPSCVVEVTAECTDNIGAVSPLEFKTIVAGGRQQSVSVKLKTRYAGLGTVKIKSIHLHDYLGIITLHLDSSRYEKAVGKIKIMPNIPDTGSQTELLKATSENASFDDNESESDENALGLTGVPGYDHRQYEIGDPLKRINWKLSSKRDELMVRLDEKVTASSQAFFLDIPSENHDPMFAMNIDNIVEASLAMLSMLIMEGFESEYNYYLDGWKSMKIKQAGDIIELQNDLAAIAPYPQEKRFAFSHEIGKTAPICFTACMATSQGDFSSLMEEFNGSFVVTRLSGLDKQTENIWLVDETFEFRKMT